MNSNDLQHLATDLCNLKELVVFWGEVTSRFHQKIGFQQNFSLDFPCPCRVLYQGHFALMQIKNCSMTCSNWETARWNSSTGATKWLQQVAPIRCTSVWVCHLGFVNTLLSKKLLVSSEVEEHRGELTPKKHKQNYHVIWPNTSWLGKPNRIKVKL